MPVLIYSWHVVCKTNTKRRRRRRRVCHQVLLHVLRYRPHFDKIWHEDLYCQLLCSFLPDPYLTLHKHEQNSIMLAKFHVFSTGQLTSSLFWVFVKSQLVCYCIWGLCSFPMLMGQDIMTLQEPPCILPRVVDIKSIYSSQQSSRAKILNVSQEQV